MIKAVIQSQLRTLLFFACLLFFENNFSKLLKKNLPTRTFGDHFNCLSSRKRRELLCSLKSHFTSINPSHIFTFFPNRFLLEQTKKKDGMLSGITMFPKITSNPLLRRLIERKACNLISRVNAHQHWGLKPYDYINWASKSKVLFVKLNENRGKYIGMYHEKRFYRSQYSASDVFDG